LFAAHTCTPFQAPLQCSNRGFLRAHRAVLTAYHRWPCAPALHFRYFQRRRHWQPHYQFQRWSLLDLHAYHSSSLSCRLLTGLARSRHLPCRPRWAQAIVMRSLLNAGPALPRHHVRAAIS